jgi:hypothetical protein
MDYENAKMLYVLTKIENSMGYSAEHIRVRDMFNQKKNKIEVTCEFETLFYYFTK